MGVDCVSPAAHSAFSTPIELLQFVDALRELSGGKPVGFKLCIGHPWELFAICKAMLETGITPDFIVVDGAEGGTGAAPLEFTDHVGMPLREGLLLVHNTLVGLGLRDRIRIGAAGKVVSGLRHRARDGAGRRLVQRGARLHVRARLHPGAALPHRPLPDRRRRPRTRCAQRALVVPDKAERVFRFHQNTLKALQGAGAGRRPEAPRRDPATPHRAARSPSSEVRLLANLLPLRRPGRCWRPTRRGRLAAQCLSPLLGSGAQRELRGRSQRAGLSRPRHRGATRGHGDGTGGWAAENGCMPIHPLAQP